MIAPPPITGNAYDMDLPQMRKDWASAIDLFESDPLIGRIFPEMLVRNLILTKRQELARLAEIPADQHWFTYLETV
jgi:glutamine synthetase